MNLIRFALFPAVLADHVPRSILNSPNAFIKTRADALLFLAFELWRLESMQFATLAPIVVVQLFQLVPTHLVLLTEAIDLSANLTTPLLATIVIFITFGPTALSFTVVLPGPLCVAPSGRLGCF